VRSDAQVAEPERGNLLPTRPGLHRAVRRRHLRLPSCFEAWPRKAGAEAEVDWASAVGTALGAAPWRAQPKSAAASS
jgi:hypothetical protein